MSLFSYHIFMFPFKWEMKGREHLPFSERTNIKNFKLSPYSNWENIATPKTDTYKRELYNEKNFFYEFTHQTLYDEDASENMIQHYERKETYERDVTYKIHLIANKESLYTLKLKSISLNLYGTGVGVLLFYLENELYPDWNDVIRINQYGRRIYPPFLSVSNGIEGTKHAEIADFIAIEGLNGNPLNFFEDFTLYHPESFWKPARFITSLIAEFSDHIVLKPVIDDRMFVMCWYGNDKVSKELTEDYKTFKEKDEWYRYIFIDGDYSTCQNAEMHEKLIDKHTYGRWQKQGSLYGITRYSSVFISNNSDFAVDVLLRTFRTIYCRIAELSLVQRASILKFSEEVTSISRLEDKETSKIVQNVSDLYLQYIRFINKIYFREITAQDQGIEIYNKLQSTMKIRKQVKELDGEIEELHSYVTILEDKGRNSNIELLTIISSVIIIPSLIVAFADMHEKKYWLPPLFLVLAGITVFSIRNKKAEKKKMLMIYTVFILVFLLLFLISLFP